MEKNVSLHVTFFPNQLKKYFKSYCKTEYIMKKTFILLSFLILAFGFFATPQKASAQAFDEVAGQLRDGLCPVRKFYVTQGRVSWGYYKYGYANENDKVVIPLIYDDASNFFGGIAAVQKGDNWGVINTKGQVIVPIKYKHVGLQNGVANNRQPLGFIELVNASGKTAIATTSGKIFLNFGTFDDYENDDCEGDYMVVTKKRNNESLFAIYSYKGKAITPFISYPIGYRYRFFEIDEANGYVKANRSDGYSTYDIIDATGKIAQTNVSFSGPFVKTRWGRYYPLGKGGQKIEGLEFDTAYKATDEYYAVVMNGKKAILEMKTLTISEQYDDAKDRGILHDKQLNKWIVPYVEVKNNKSYDRKDTVDWIRIHKCDYDLYITPKRTYTTNSLNGLVVSDFQVKGIHQVFGKNVVYDLSETSKYGDRIVIYNKELLPFDFDSIIKKTSDGRLLVKGDDGIYYTCNSEMDNVETYVPPKPPVTETIHCNLNNTDYIYYPELHKIRDSRTQKEYKFNKRAQQLIIHDGICDHVMTYRKDQTTETKTVKDKDGRTHTETIVKDFELFRIIPFPEYLKNNGNRDFYRNYPEARLRWYSKLDIKTTCDSTPVKIGDGIGYKLIKTCKTSDYYDADTTQDNAIINERGTVIPFVQYRIVDVACTESDTVAVVYNPKKELFKPEGYGLVNTRGLIRVKSKYENIGKFQWVEGMFLAPVTEDGKKGYIDIKGKEVIPCKYDELSEFKNGVATATKGKKTFQIDTKNKKVK